MQRRNKTSRAKQRQEMLRELASDEVGCVTFGAGVSRAREAVYALQRIQDGTYGKCVDCRMRIPAARLQVKPEATRCVSCQTEYENKTTNYRADTNYVARKSA